jgi:hypothetical protein
MMNRKMPVKVRKKLPQRKKTEEALKINMHNLRQYSYLRHTNPGMVKDYRELYLKYFVPKPILGKSINKSCFI